MKRLAALLLLLASPALAEDRWFLVLYQDGGRAPVFRGPFPTLAECEAERRAMIGRAEAYHEQSRAPAAYRTVQLLRESSLCERR